MATKVALAIKAEAAIKRIEARARDLGVEFDPLPLLYRDHYVLHAIQLEGIADIIDAIRPDERLEQAMDLVESGNWTKAELEAILRGEHEPATN